MIVWLNGTFGAGMTTMARALVTRLPDARIFDAEHVGFLLRQVLPEPPGDFQHLPPWRPARSWRPPPGSCGTRAGR
jgi:hypothetical protein